jgi:uncharacterized protein
MAEQQAQQVETGPRPILPILKLQPKPHLVGSKCGSCGAIFLDVKRAACSKCGVAGSLQQVDLSDKGKVWVFSVIHQSFPGVKTPYVTAVVDLPEGVSVKSNLIDVDPEDLEKNPQKAFGMAVELVVNEVATDRQGNPVMAFQFRPRKD